METALNSTLTDIRQFIQQQLGRDVGAVGDGESLLEAGVMDSIGVIQLVAYIEERLGVPVSEDDMMPENFDSISAIVAFVERGGSSRAG